MVQGTQLQKCLRGQNLDVLKRIECKEVGVTSNDVGGMAAYRKFEEFVVLRIAADCYSHINANPLSFARQRRHKRSDIFFIHIPPELLSAQNFVQFCKYGKGKQNFPLSKRQIKSLARL